MTGLGTARAVNFAPLKLLSNSLGTANPGMDSGMESTGPRFRISSNPFLTQTATRSPDRLLFPDVKMKAAPGRGDGNSARAQNAPGSHRFMRYLEGWEVRRVGVRESRVELSDRCRSGDVFEGERGRPCEGPPRASARSQRLEDHAFAEPPVGDGEAGQLELVDDRAQHLGADRDDVGALAAHAGHAQALLLGRSHQPAGELAQLVGLDDETLDRGVRVAAGLGERQARERADRAPGRDARVGRPAPDPLAVPGQALAHARADRA